ncbi:RagB/SusD family nutrient uptake outer membrane protein [soil metagenome]
MKKLHYIIIFFYFGLSSCKKVIDLYPESNLNTGTFYSNNDEVKAGLTGCYNGMQAPMSREWQFTELRSDNSYMGSTGSTNSFNRDLSDLDEFIPATTNDGLYQYWLDTYYNIRSCNIVLQKLGVNYDPATGAISLSNIAIPISDANRKQYAGEALFIRAYHYFNLVRLYGGVFLIHTPVSPTASKTMNRASVDDIYKLIVADLSTAATFMNGLKFNQVPAADKGRATSWAAKALLGKVYLTQNKKAEAIAQLQDVVSNSGYGLQATYAGVFSITGELNNEIIFTIGYKAGGFGLGSPFGNTFGPLGSSSDVINGSGSGWNTPSSSIDSAYTTADSLRRKVTIAKYKAGTPQEVVYVKKYLTPVTITFDGESDWPIIRYADVLLMLAEAQGNTATSVGYISQVRVRAGLPSITGPLVSTADFEKELTEQRRLEFAFENQRWFDLLRYKTTLSTIDPLQILKDHFAYEYVSHYSTYTAPTPTIAFLQGNVTVDKLLLPIPQHEIDTNTQLVIQQNPGY